MKCQLAPSILSCDFASLGDSVLRMMEGGADWIHMDVMDGQFVPPISFGSEVVKNLRPLGKTPFEVHLMTVTPERQFEAFIEAGCTRVIFHAEATSHAHRLIESLHEAGVGAGIAINPGSPVELVEPVVDMIDLVLVMTVNPGWGGQEMIESALDKVAHIRGLRPNLDIEVDGGISPATIGCARRAGANVFVAGSFVARSPDIATALQELRAACV